MFRFENPTLLWLLLLIPVLAIIYYRSFLKSKKRLKKFGDTALLKQLSPMLSNKRRLLKFVLMQAILALLIIIIARPQIGSKIATKKKAMGIETIIALDISNSMLAQDVALSRLDKSKLLIEDLIKHFDNDKIGLIVFAGDAYVQLPITTDYVSAKMFLNDITPSLIGTQGTDIGKALNLAIHSFSQDTKSGKAIIVITDGEDNEGGAEAMATQARKKGINVYMLGIGSANGAKIPLEDGTYLKDKGGNEVITHLNESMCKQIAAAGKGMYIHVDNDNDAQDILDAELGKLQKGEVNNVVYSDFDEQFQAVAILILLLMICEVCILERKRKE